MGHRRLSGAHSAWRLLATSMAAAVCVGVPTLARAEVAGPASARRSERVTVVHAAARYGATRGYHVGVAVVDRQTGQLYTGGDAYGTFASESVVKVFIATRLLVAGEMHGRTADMAYKMITQSDDAMASALYGRVGGDRLINWVKRHYHVRRLGSPPTHANWWGNTRITPVGLVRLYAKLARDRRVAGWLLNAMHHARRRGSDGTYQFFGLPSATRHAAIKQGWGCEYTNGCAEADFNSTGYVDHNRYAVALLARGSLSTYGAPISRMLTGMARTLLPNGIFPAPPPRVMHLSRKLASTKGGAVLDVVGQNFVRVRDVRLGTARVRTVRRLSDQRLRLQLPPHAAGSFAVRVDTAYGSSRRVPGAWLRFVPAPSVRSVSPGYLPVRGGARLTVRGNDFRAVRAVRIGGVRAGHLSVHSAYRLTVVAPRHRAGRVGLEVITRFGHSSSSAASVEYVTRPHITTSSLPNGVVGQPYSAALATKDGRPGTWSVVAGALPAGLRIEGAVIQGTPTTAGKSSFTVRFTDKYGQHVDQPLTITVTR